MRLCTTLLCLLLTGCEGTPEPKQDAAPPTADPPSEAPPPTWEEPLLELLAGEVPEATLLDLVPRLVELVPAAGPGDDDLARFRPAPVRRVPLGAGWEALEFSVTGEGLRPLRSALELVETRTQRLLHVRRAECTRTDDTLSWELELRAFVQPRVPTDGAAVRGTLRRCAQLADAYVLASWELAQLSAAAEGLAGIRFDALSLDRRALRLELHVDDPGHARTLAKRLEAPSSGTRYEVELRQRGAQGLLDLTRVVPELPQPAEAPAALRQALTAKGQRVTAAREIVEQVFRLSGSDPRTRLAAACALTRADEPKLAMELLFPALDADPGWVPGLVGLAHARLASRNRDREAMAKDVLVLAQSHQWPVFAELVKHERCAPLREDPRFLLALLAAGRDAHLPATRHDPFALPPPPPPAPPPRQEQLERQLKQRLQEVQQLLGHGIEDEARSRADYFLELLAELRELNPEAANRWRSRYDALGEFVR